MPRCYRIDRYNYGIRDVFTSTSAKCFNALYGIIQRYIPQHLTLLEKNGSNCYHLKTVLYREEYTSLSIQTRLVWTFGLGFKGGAAELT